MAQSNSNESNVRGMFSLWQNDTVYPPIPWEEWSDLFQLAVIAKEKIEVDYLLKPIETYHPKPPVLENTSESETKTQKVPRLDISIREQKRFDNEEAASKKT